MNYRRSDCNRQQWGSSDYLRSISASASKVEIQIGLEPLNGSTKVAVAYDVYTLCVNVSSSKLPLCNILKGTCLISESMCRCLQLNVSILNRDSV